MWQRKLNRLLQIIAGVIGNLLTIIWKIIKKFRVIQQPKFRRPLLISSSILIITAILTLSLTGLFNYTLGTSASSPYIPPPAGNSNYYIEATTEGLWNEFLSHYSDTISAKINYVGKSFIFKDILIDESKLNRRYESYILINLVQFVPRDPSELQELKEGDVVDIIGVCAGISDEYQMIVVANCQFLPAGLVPLPLPGGPPPLSPSY